MPVSIRLTGLLLLLAGSLSANAAQSIWPAQPTAASSLLGDYRQERCPKAPPPAYTGHLQLDSKYDQSDASKSRLVAQQSKDTQRIRKQVQGYIGGLIKAVQVFQRTSKANEANIALACLDQWLDAWASKSALLSDDASKTGVASRKWALAAIASTLLKVQALSDRHYQLSPVQRRWLQQLSAKVVAEYEPRRYDTGIYFNNHDYWAAWAVAAAAMLLDDDKGLAWADVALRRAFSQLAQGDGDYQYLPLEVARGRLAADYSHYALVPLMLLVEAAEFNGRPLSEQERSKLAGLANFAIRAVLEPKTLPELSERQTEVGPHKMVWLLPFLNRYPQHQWARRLYQAQGDEINHYSQVGGDLKPLYPQLN
ncbi:polysaccharide lyase [Pseudomonas sp. SH1-B]